MESVSASIREMGVVVFGVDRNDDFGDRMKGYEAAAEAYLDPTLPICARIDGRSFSRFTRGMERPFDARMSRAMIETTKKLVDASHARIGYTQSDEISLVFAGGPNAEATFFGGRVQKLASVLAGLATAAFNGAILADEGLAPYASRLPHFDCRVFNVPDEMEAANVLLWREMDATKNAVQMAAYEKFSAKKLHGRNTGEMHQMLAALDIDFDAYPAFFKRGTFLRRVTFDRPFTAAELERIPAAHRPAPDSIITRSEVREIAMPPFVTVANRVDVVFGGAEPTVALKAA